MVFNSLPNYNNLDATKLKALADPFTHNTALRYIAVKKETLLATSNFSFSHNVFYLFFILNAHYNVVCNFFQFGQSKILSSGNRLNVAKLTISLFARVENTVYA